MNAEVISIGTELLLGEIVDTNSAYIARQLRDIGMNLFYLTTVGDNLERSAAAIRDALGRADVVITTGGLGPTVDDMTRQAVARATDRELEFRPDLLEEIAERFRQMGAIMSDNNRLQAYIPAGAIPIHNRTGTAPCFIVEAPQGTVISLPGVPHEMKDILAASVLPYLRERVGGQGIIKARVLRTAGIGESQIDARITDLMAWSNPTVGLAAHTGQTDIRITARADSEAEADGMIAEAEAVIRERVGDFIYGTGQEPFNAAFARLLRDNGLTLAVSYTGPDGATVAARLREALEADETVLPHVETGDVDALLARLDWTEADFDAAHRDYCTLSQSEAERLIGATGASVVLAMVTDADGTGITAQAGDQSRSRCYGYGVVEGEKPFWAETWAMSMAWRLLLQTGLIRARSAE
ncbi:CinA family nicotinamide mononucleotide deamidase-related protein [Aggregatilinea lenta]|uniref:CinA family nicotinamide mononucleotide deamidase-related protein n=1 Tax=Aggregatilinea lenta TaxID=913108 RepID=UPI0013C2D639|nr:CinA family nicotinamide mononucleotide deamidase-related protein [Aggregatilinea lenta]